MNDDDKKDDMSREQEQRIRREEMSPEKILATVTAHLGRLENRYFEEDYGNALLRQEEHKCGDGRDDRVERFGMFGGTLGLMASGIANLDRVEASGQPLLTNPEDIIQAMVEKFGGISCHTDSHKHGVHSGCRHVARLIKNPDAYGLTGRFGKALVRFLKEINEREADSRVHSITYAGDHKEIAVVQIVNGDGYRLRVRGFDRNTGIQVFVWHKTEVDRAAEILSDWLYDYAKITESRSESKDSFRAAGVTIINDQTVATAKELAPGFEIIQVQPRQNETLNIYPIGTVPKA